MSEAVYADGCKCEPCPIDIRAFGYPTRKEDPSFEGTQCNWHEVVFGKYGDICISGVKNGKVILMATLHDTNKRKRNGFAPGDAVEFGVSDFSDFIKLIGAKK